MSFIHTFSHKFACVCVFFFFASVAAFALPITRQLLLLLLIFNSRFVNAKVRMNVATCVCVCVSYAYEVSFNKPTDRKTQIFYSWLSQNIIHSLIIHTNTHRQELNKIEQKIKFKQQQSQINSNKFKQLQFECNEI